MTVRVALVAALCLAFPRVAAAHAFLDHASPSPGSVVNGAPSSIVLSFDRGIEAVFSSAHLTEDGDDTPIETEKATGDPHDATKLILVVPRLHAGTYHVSWSVVGRDGHRTQGDYSFVIR